MRDRELGPFFFFTTQGSLFLADLLLRRGLKYEQLTFDKTQGTLAGNLVFDNVEIKDLGFFPPGNIFKAQRIILSFQSLDLNGFVIDLFNARLWLNESDPILVYGKYNLGQVDFSFYTKSLDAYDLLFSFLPKTALEHIFGTISDIDIAVTGPWQEPEIQGQFKVDHVKYKDFVIQDSFGDFDLTLKDVGSQPNFFGRLNLRQGMIFGHRTAIVKLDRGSIVFSAVNIEPSFDVKAASVIEGTEISISLQGSFTDPKLSLTSVPSLSQDRLLLMIATGKKWSSLTTLAEDKTISANLAGDFLDYFVFSGRGRKMAEHFGVKDIAIIFEERTKGVKVTQTVGPSAEVSYGIQQTRELDGTATTIHSVGGQKGVTQDISIEVERKLQQGESKDTPSEIQASDSLLLKYKKEF